MFQSVPSPLDFNSWLEILYFNATQLCLNHNIFHQKLEDSDLMAVTKPNYFLNRFTVVALKQKACNWPNIRTLGACTCTLPLSLQQVAHCTSSWDQPDISAGRRQRHMSAHTHTHTWHTHNDKAQHVRYWPAVVSKQTKSITFPFLHE